MIVEIDAGNTRIKWRLVDAEGQPLMPAQSVDNEQALLSALAQLQQNPVGASENKDMPAEIKRLRIASVRDAAKTSNCWQS